MNIYTIMMTALMCLMLAACIMAITEDAHAQSADQKLAVREGLGEKELDESKMPGKFEAGLALGSIIAMIGVMKYV